MIWLRSINSMKEILNYFKLHIIEMKKRHLIDLHIHSNFSDGKLGITEIVDLYGKKGFSAIAITDHLADSQTLTGLVTRKLSLSLSNSNMPEYLQTLHSEAIRAKKMYNMLVIPGVEITLNSWSKQHGAHLVFLNVDQYINPNKSIENLLLDNKKYFSIAAHPLWEESYEFKTTYLWDQRENLKNLFDAWECATAQKFSQEIYDSGLAYVCSSDFHSPARFESWKMQTYLEDINLENLYEQIRSKQVEPIWV
jgi:hypothetical protein